MAMFESGWEDKDGLKFFMRGWEPVKKPKALVCLIHGLGEHTGRYGHVGEAFTRAGYALVGFDLRGHGKSGGPRGFIPSYAALMADISEFLGLMAKRYPRLPRFLYGHSLGGTLVLNYCLRLKPKVAVGFPWAHGVELKPPPPPPPKAWGAVLRRAPPRAT